MFDYYATCPKGFEDLLAGELASLGCERIRPLTGQVSFSGDEACGYRVCLWSHLASRVVLVLARIDAANADELYESVLALPWEDHVPRTALLAIDAHGTNDELRNTQFTSLRVKDAISDNLVAKAGFRVQTDPARPSLRLAVRLHSTSATIGVDLSGEPLFRRGYAVTQGGIAPLRADYAAALLASAGWYRACRAEGPALAVEGAGAGTLLCEAASQALDRAPGLLRHRWGFEGWGCFSQNSWQNLLDDAQQRADEGKGREVHFFASDTRPGWRRIARKTTRAAGIPVAFEAVAADAWAGMSLNPGVAVADLAWFDEQDQLAQMRALSALAQLMTGLSPHAVLSCFAFDASVDRVVGAEASRVRNTMHGSSEASIRSYFLGEERAELPRIPLGQGRDLSVFLPATSQFASRLAKVAKERAKWARREDVSCYRVYDADLPDYAVALDLFHGSAQTPGTWLRVSEYAAPKSVDPELARARLMDALAVAPEVLDVRPQDVQLRVRTHAKGGSQYANERAPERRSQDARREKRDSRDKNNCRDQRVDLRLGPDARLVEEGGLTFEIDLANRLDCGLFLDTRDVRAELRELAKGRGKPVDNALNLFAYTGTATCYMADGGAAHTTTVDISHTYLAWAQRNMVRNGFDGPEHEFVQADVVDWISEQRRTKYRWGLIYCDPPTFSNSARMRKRSFEIQRDHAELLIGVSRLLTRGGVCVFVCNLRKFKPDVEALAKAKVEIEDITERTIPHDFARTPNVHHCYLVRRMP